MERIIADGVNLDLQELAQIWDNGQFFCLCGNTANVKKIAKMEKAIPAEYKKGHFGVFTSGSSGQPKLFIGKKSRTIALLKQIHIAQKCEPVESTICTLPLSYSYAFVNQWVWAHENNRSLIHTDGLSDPEKLETAFQNSSSAMICLVASQLRPFYHHFSGKKFPGVIRVNFAGERFPQAQIDLLKATFPNATIFNNYGCTEAMPRIAIRTAEETRDASNIGKPLPGVKLKADDDGHLLFRSDFSAVAQLDDAGVRKIAEDHWIPTGDMGNQLTDGSWRVTGRTDEVFKRCGEKVSISGMIEELNAEFGDMFSGYSLEDANGEAAWTLVLSNAPDSTQVRQVLIFLRERYTRAHWPIRLESLKEFPLLQNGKIDVTAVKLSENKKLHWRQRI